MKKQKVLIAAASLFFIMVGIASCVNNKGKQNEITFDTIELDERVYLFANNDTTVPYAEVKIDFKYPKRFNAKDDLARLQQIVVGTFFNNEAYDSYSPQEALDKYMENYTAEYRELGNSYYEDMKNFEGDYQPSWYWYQLYKSNEVLYEDENILSYSVNHSDYTGGAHGSMQVLYYTIDLNELTTLSEEDLYKPNYQHTLTDRILNRLMKKYEVERPEDLLGEGFFDIESIGPNNNFWINDEGIHYIFNQYEIAPYSMGPIEVTVPYADVKSILNTKGVVKKYIEQ